jgi:radical SAM protein with 4Fe4S-binding SPASM domain
MGWVPEPGRNLLERLARAGLCPPRALTVVITEGCNLGCEHCWVRSSHPSTTKPVASTRLRQLMCEFAELGGEGVRLTGGEPLIHPDWFGLVDYCCRELRFRTVTIQTNATTLTEADVGGLSSLDCKGLRIEVSLEGASARTHDRVRGEGSFVRTLEGLRLLAVGGLGRATRVAFTEMEHNLKDLPDLLMLLDRMGIGALTSASVVRHGRAKEAEQLGPPDPAQYVELLDRYHSDAHFRALCGKMASIPALRWWAGRAHPDPHCCNFIQNPYITADGRIYPCALLHADEFAGSGIYDRSLREAIEGAIPVWAELRRRSRRRAEELEPCQTCLGKLHCAGGCMARAYPARSDLMAVEDRCTLRQAVYGWKGEGDQET